MATRSTIAIEKKNGTISMIYCHWDGYLTNNGDILLRHYSNPDKIYDLIKLGSLSSLNQEVENSVQMAFESESPTIFEFDNFDNYQNSGVLQSYNYIFKDDKWLVEFNEKYADLDSALAEELFEENTK